MSKDFQKVLPNPKYRRILLKLSGEALLGKQDYGIDPDFLEYFVREIQPLWQNKIQMGIVVGGGNIFRGLKAAAKGMERVSADNIGMVATLINALTLQEILERHAIPSKVLSALPTETLTDPYLPKSAQAHLENGYLLLLAGGTGHPFFTTDTAAALRALELKAEILLKATRVDGVYDKDPLIYKESKKFAQLSYFEFLKQNLQVMDATAVTLCKDNNLPILVFDFRVSGNLKRVIEGKKIGTIIG